MADAADLLDGQVLAVEDAALPQVVLPVELVGIAQITDG